MVASLQSRLYRPLVAFDFDGTLTCRDSFVAFLAWRFTPARYGIGMLRLAPAAVAFLFHRDRGRLKAALVREFLTGESRQDLARRAERFAASHARRLLRPDAIRSWKMWQNQNARLVIVTASPEIVVAPFARGLGAEALIGTRLVYTASDLASGELDGPNCRGPEKVARLREVFGDEISLDAAYGDSDGDTAMLALAEEAGMKVFGERP
ncbi:MAG TPA: HAD-IB family hydrolase [Caulobacteraceae bacterium]